MGNSLGYYTTMETDLSIMDDDKGKFSYFFSHYFGTSNHEENKATGYLAGKSILKVMNQSARLMC